MDDFVVGDPEKAKARPSSSDAGVEDDEPVEDDTAPFAVEIGHGASFDRGFAFGALRDAEGGTAAYVGTIGHDGKLGALAKLARVRGDLDPPVVTGAGASVIAAYAEPNAGGRAIRLSKITGKDVVIGPELSEGRDESLALDLAATPSGDRAIVVWDDLDKEGTRSIVKLAVLEVGDMHLSGLARPVTPSKLDAEGPKIVARPNGYWLVYLARSAEGGAKKPDDKPEEKADKKPAKAKAKKAAKDDDEGEDDIEASGEDNSARWIEAVPLDVAGAPTGAPRALTPKNGHALAFDLEQGDDGGAIVAYRDDDLPSGAAGGRVMVVTVRDGGASEPKVLAEEGVGSGMPDLLPGWLAIASISGKTRIAPMSLKGELSGALEAEALIGNAELIAAHKDSVLLARPSGKVVRLSVVRCTANPAAPQ
jgi:hypothetical protein